MRCCFDAKSSCGVGRGFILRTLLLLPACACCGGCSVFYEPFLAKGPRAEGTWTGQLVSIRVHDRTGTKEPRQYDAAALRIETGPRTVRGTADSYTLRGDDVPCLSRVGVAIVDPKELSVPLGTRVKIRGEMVIHSATVLISEPEYTSKTVRRVYRAPGEPPGSVLIIHMWAEPEVLRRGEKGREPNWFTGGIGGG